MLIPSIAVLLHAASPREAHLSSAVALVNAPPAVAKFLDQPGRSELEGHFRFPKDLGEDVIFGIDQEFIEGVRRPLFVRGGDWMGLIGLQRTGAVWIATGTADTMKGRPSRDRKWIVRSLERPLLPDVWYRMATEVDFARREFVSLTVEGDGWTRQLSLKGLNLDYPNEMPFSDRTMAYFVFAMRGRSMMKSGAARVAFDDVKAWVMASDGRRQPAFSSDFEINEPVRAQPVTTPTIDLRRYRSVGWYLERGESLISIERVPWARSGTCVLFTDARLD